MVYLVVHSCKVICYEDEFLHRLSIRQLLVGWGGGGTASSAIRPEHVGPGKRWRIRRTRRVLRRGEPHSLAAVLHRNEEVRQRTTRQDGLLSVPRSRTKAGKRRFCARAPALYIQPAATRTGFAQWTGLQTHFKTTDADLYHLI